MPVTSCSREEFPSPTKLVSDTSRWPTQRLEGEVFGVDHEASSSGSTSARGESIEVEYSDDECEAPARTQARNFCEDDVKHNMASLVASLRDARIRASSRRAALSHAVSVIAEIDDGSCCEELPFSVTISSMSGQCHDVCDLYSHMPVHELCDLVGRKFEIPTFAVYLIVGSQALHASMLPTTLGMLDIREGSQLTLAKNFGWGKPDIVLLSGLEKQWQGRECSIDL